MGLLLNLSISNTNINEYNGGPPSIKFHNNLQWALIFVYSNQLTHLPIFFALLLVCRSLLILYRQSIQLHSPSGVSLRPRHAKWNTLGQVSQQITSPVSLHTWHSSSLSDTSSTSSSSLCFSSSSESYIIYLNYDREWPRLSSVWWPEMPSGSYAFLAFFFHFHRRHWGILSILFD